MEAQTNVTLKKASIKSASLKKGELTITIVARVDESNATIADLNEMTSGSFSGTITVKGRSLQLSLIPDKPPAEEK